MQITIDGKGIAAECSAQMRNFVVSQKIAPTLTALTVDPTVPTQQFLKIKSRVASEVGIAMTIQQLPRTATMDEVEEAVMRAVESSDGVVLQLPFPEQFSMDVLLALLPSDVDPDCMGVAAGALLRAHSHSVLPPVVSALRVICDRYGIERRNKKVVVIGQGRLVGAPGALWFEEEGADVVRLTKSSGELSEYTRDADIILLGAGVPGMLTPDMLREGVVILDAGTSEEGGKVVGDADPACASVASISTPVPGGIGPIAVAELFGNLLRLRYNYGDAE